MTGIDMEDERVTLTKDYIRANYRLKTQTQMADVLNLAQNTVSKYMTTMGLNTYHKIWREADTAFLAAHRHLSKKVLARRMGYTIDMVGVHIRKLDAKQLTLCMPAPIGKPAPGWKPKW